MSDIKNIIANNENLTLMEDYVPRYSDNIPYNERKFWYFTTHGIGPGTIPKDLKLLKTIEISGGDYICLDGVLNTSELSYYDVKEAVPPESLIIENYLHEKGFNHYTSIEENNGEISIYIEWGDWKHQHLYCDHLMKELEYELYKESITEENGSDCYSAERIFIKEN